MEREKVSERGVCQRGSTEVGYPKAGQRTSGLMRWAAVTVAAAVVLAAVFFLVKYSDRLLGFIKGISLDGGGTPTESNVGWADASDESEETEPSEGGESEIATEETVETTANTGISAEVVERDLSLAERGDSYLINYTDGAVDAEGLLEMGFQGGRYSYTEQPVVLILHTHTAEGYYGFDPSESLHIMTKSVVTVGEKIAYELNKRGIPTVHCTVIHDGDDPYGSAEETVKTMLRIYPTVEYVIDLHRMAELDGEGRIVRTESRDGLAQLRVTVSSEGKDTRGALALALCLRRRLNADGRRLCMPTVLTDNRYNAHLSRYYLKVDVGSSGNLAEQAIASGELFAEALASILKK